ncbi:MAG: hypothetical protein K2Q21_14235 [Chitinophagaceae bacterium]|nr:hypothetical protein [Chitinophagaceae bacterium]
MPEKRIPLLFLLLICFTLSLSAQSVSGKWYGVGHIEIDGDHENYLTELIIKQDGQSIKGEFNYYFRDSLFKNKITGTYIKKKRILGIDKFSIIFYKSASTKKAVMCNMTGIFELRVAKAGSVLNGSITSIDVQKYLMPVINYRMIRDTVIHPKQKNEIDTVHIAKREIMISKPETKSSVSKKTIDSIPIRKEPTVATNNSIKKDSLVNKAIAPEIKTVEQFNSRKKEYARVIEVDNSKIRLEVYDNGTIDYDSVSLLLNGKVILPKTMLNHKSVKVNIELDESLDFNELGMFAENLGLIPPNTAALIIHDGKKTYEITLNSDFTKSAIIQLKTKKGTKKD